MNRVPESSQTHRILYQERFASGSSWRSMLHRAGGAHNCLRVTLTSHSLSIGSSWMVLAPFVWLADLQHEIPLDRIVAITCRSRGRFNIRFLAPDASEQTVTLAVWKPERLMRAFKETQVQISEP